MLNDGSVTNFFQSFQTSTVDLQKAFFCTHLVVILKFWERIAKNEDLLRFSQYKKIDTLSDAMVQFFGKLMT